MTLKGLCVLITQRANHYVNTCRDGNSVSLKQCISILDNFRCYSFLLSRNICIVSTWSWFCILVLFRRNVITKTALQLNTAVLVSMCSSLAFISFCDISQDMVLNHRIISSSSQLPFKNCQTGQDN